jgi:hypothetical protein
MNSGETTICPTDDHRAPATAPPTWCPPFQVDISKAAKTGENMLEIEVTNLWINRLIGDEVFPYENIYPCIRNGHPLPAGSSRKTFEFRFAGEMQDTGKNKCPKLLGTDWSGSDHENHA